MTQLLLTLTLRKSTVYELATMCTMENAFTHRLHTTHTHAHTHITVLTFSSTSLPLLSLLPSPPSLKTTAYASASATRPQISTTKFRYFCFSLFLFFDFACDSSMSMSWVCELKLWVKAGNHCNSLVCLSHHVNSDVSFTTLFECV